MHWVRHWRDASSTALRRPSKRGQRTVATLTLTSASGVHRLHSSAASAGCGRAWELCVRWLSRPVLAGFAARQRCFTTASKMQRAIVGERGRHVRKPQWTSRTSRTKQRPRLPGGAYSVLLDVLRAAVKLRRRASTRLTMSLQRWRIPACGSAILGRNKQGHHYRSTPVVLPWLLRIACARHPGHGYEGSDDETIGRIGYGIRSDALGRQARLRSSHHVAVATASHSSSHGQRGPGCEAGRVVAGVDACAAANASVCARSCCRYSAGASPGART